VRPAGQDDCRKSIKETKFCDLRFYSTVSSGVTKSENKRDFQGCELFSVETVFIDQKTSRVQKVGVECRPVESSPLVLRRILKNCLNPFLAKCAVDAPSML
jgi:hypothetical protein